MKQPSLLSVLFAPAPAAASASRARESDSDAFARALQSTRPEPPAPATPQPRQAATAESRSGIAPERHNEQPAAVKSKHEAPLRSASQPREDTVKQALSPPPKTVEDSASDSDPSDSPLLAEIPLPQSLKELEQHGLPAPLQKALITDIARLMEQLEQGSIDEEEALATLQNLLQEHGLSSLFSDIEQQLQQLAGPRQEAEGDGKASLLAMLGTLQQQLTDSRPSGGKRAMGANSEAAGARAVEAIVINAPQNRTENRMAEPGETLRPQATTAPSASPSDARTAPLVAASSAEAKDAESPAAVPLKDSLRTVPGEGDLLAPKNTDKAATDNKMASLANAVVQMQSPGAERGPAAAVSAAQSAVSPAAPIPTERGFTVQTMVNTLVGQPNWGQAVSQRVMWLAQQNISEAQLRLDPPDLGPVNVKISVQNDQAQVVFTSHSAGVREALDQSAQRLRELFAEQGLDLVNVDVSDHREREGHEAGEQGGQLAGNGSGGEADSGDAPQWVMEGQLTLVDHYA